MAEWNLCVERERRGRVERREKRIHRGKKWMEKSETFFSVKYAIFSICFRDLPCSSNGSSDGRALVKLCVSFVIFCARSLTLWLSCRRRVSNARDRREWRSSNACVSNLTFSHLEFLQKDVVYVLDFLLNHHFSWIVCALVCIAIIDVALHFRLRWNSNPIHTLSPMMLQLFRAHARIASTADFGRQRRRRWSSIEKWTTNWTRVRILFEKMNEPGASKNGLHKDKIPYPIFAIMMMLKYRSHQSSSNLVLLWCAHSQQNGDKRTEQNELERRRARGRDGTAKKNNHPNRKKRRTKARNAHSGENWGATETTPSPPKRLCTRKKPKKQKRKKTTVRWNEQSRKKKCWNENTNFQNIRTIYIAANEKSCIRKPALLLLLMFIEVQHLSASRWFPISLIHFQPTRSLCLSLSHFLTESVGCLFFSSAAAAAATVVAFIHHRNVLFALYPAFYSVELRNCSDCSHRTLHGKMRWWCNSNYRSWWQQATHTVRTFGRNENTLWQI